MTTLPPDDPTLHLYHQATTALLLWQLRLHPRPIARSEEDLPDTAQGQIGFEGLISAGSISLPEGTSPEVADRLWSTHRYKAYAAALLALAPRAVERRWTPLKKGLTSSTGIDLSWRATIAVAAEALGIRDRPAWMQELKADLDARFADPLVWNGIEVLVTAVREMGTMSEHDVERFLERAGVPREPWPAWMPGDAPPEGFYFS